MPELNPTRMYTVLHEIKKVAMEASLTGSLKKGASVLAEAYNKCLAAVSAQDEMAAHLFPTLDPASVHMDQVGAAAALLASYVRPSTARSRRDEEEFEIEELEEEEE